MSYEAICYEVRDAIAILTLNRPHARNALNQAMRTELADAVGRIRGNDGVNCVILTGAGEAFCAGGDLRGMSASARTSAQSRNRIRDLHPWLRELINLEKPVIAAIDGPAFGGGFSLALAADFVLATPRARFCQVFGRIGLVPDMAAMYLLPRIVGLQRAKELVFSARIVTAEEALERGIVFALHEPEALMPAAFALAARFGSASTLAIGLSKSILNQSLHLDQHAMAELEAFAQGICMDSASHKEAVGKFLRGEDLPFKWERFEDAEASAAGERRKPKRQEGS